MAITVSRGKADEAINQMIETLRVYQADHPKARIDLYRQNSVSVRIRVIDPDFTGTTRSERSRAVWKYLDALSDDAQSDISSLILLTPEETARSLANLEFEDPTPSRL
jgi:stress-induced morphogen